MVTVINPAVTSVPASTMPSTVTAVPVTSSASTAAFMQLTAEKLNRIATMVNTSQAATRQSLRSEFKTDQEETAERAVKKARFSADVVFCKKGNEKQFHFNEELQEKIQIASWSSSTRSVHQLRLSADFFGITASGSSFGRR